MSNPRLLSDRSLENFFWYYKSKSEALDEKRAPFRDTKEFIMILLRELRRRKIITLADHKVYMREWIGAWYEI